MSTLYGLPLRRAYAWPTTGRPPVRSHGAPHAFNGADGGAYRVAFTVAIDGTPTTPVRRRVRLFHLSTGRLIREQWSAADGTGEFANVAAGKYLVVTDDYTGTYEAVAATEVSAVP